MPLSAEEDHIVTHDTVESLVYSLSVKNRLKDQALCLLGSTTLFIAPVSFSPRNRQRGIFVKLDWSQTPKENIVINVRLNSS